MGIDAGTKESSSPDREIVMVKKIRTRFTCLFLLVAAITSAMLVAGKATPAVAAFEPNEATSYTASSAVTKEKTAKSVRSEDFSDIKLCPGGMAFGVRMYTPGVLIVSINQVNGKGGPSAPASEGGLAVRDLITHINGKEIRRLEDVGRMIENSNGEPLTVTVNRYGKTMTHTVTPVLSEPEHKYRLGILVRDKTAGIGTVTFIDPATGAFGGLGHGICDGETGELIPFSRGQVTDVHIQNVVKGLAGTPGELRGTLGQKKTGSLSSNTQVGVFGFFSKPPIKFEAIPIAKAGEVKVGKAQIYCTLEDGECRSHEIEITKIHSANRATKCFSIRVTDEELLSITGGIVQGMSGSPIIQNGKLVGAVTHVLLNDPTSGYGIFIENMLNAAQMPLAKAS